MQLLNLTNALALLAFIALIISFIGSYKNKDKKFKGKTIISIIIGMAVLIITVIKNNSDAEASELSNRRADTIQMNLKDLNIKNASLFEKMKTIDTLNLYLKRVDSIGVKRNETTNQPVITSKFYNKIERVETLNQN